MANALEARGARELDHGQDLLAELNKLHERATAILTKAEDSGDLRAALLAIREVRGCLEFGSKLTGQIAEQHLHLHGHQMLSPEAHQQFVDAVAEMKAYKELLPPKGSIRSDVHLLSGEDALPKTISVEATEVLP